ncbi:hypothetical protein FY528_13270 [Hymenobacter lutimineralis]|uniref:TonB C-terminal domain-containing protein n=1 Tax=Hymenobacter lutimineralis TaxID=2606448 RepID=A0A5D6UXX6_9BACT|nr:energy transducer TonB [Hymenobacter lutimineralis]TYZ08413.1 hypothetical protein FY528_13270 [Hymenobacter lutimineralis]
MKKLLALLSALLGGLPTYAQLVTGPTDFDSTRHYRQENGNVYYDNGHFQNSWKSSATYRVQTTRLTANSWRDTGYDLKSGRRFRSITHDNTPIPNHAIDSSWYENGQLKARVEYVEADLTVYPTAYLFPSQIRPVSAAASLFGELVTYYPDGKIRWRERYEDGNTVSRTRYTVSGSEEEKSVGYRLPPTLQNHLGRNSSKVRLPLKFVTHDSGPIKVRKAFLFLDGKDQISKVELRLPKKRFSEDAQAQAENGQVLVLSVVQANGQSGRAQIIAGGLYAELDGVAMQAVSKLLHNWRPAFIEGEAVATYFRVPVKILLK